nr:MAG TPA_asm: hypothetical protein [Bacteriophage sp.]
MHMNQRGHGQMMVLMSMKQHLRRSPALHQMGRFVAAIQMGVRHGLIFHR